MTISSPCPNEHSWPKRISDLPLDVQEHAYLSAREAYYNLISLQFQLSYHAHISIVDLDNMTKYEYRAFYEELKKQKESEKSAIEEASKNSGVT